MDKAKLKRICQRQQQLHANAFTSCEYPGAYASVMRHPKRRALVRKQKLHKPGEDSFRDHSLLYWIANPAAKKKYDLLHMPPKEAFLTILREDHGFSEAEIQATVYIIQTAPRAENSSWNPWRAFGEGPNVTASQTYARNGMDVACGIPQFKPCREFGDTIGQAHAYAEYVRRRYGGALGAAEHKRAYGWY